MMSVVSCHELLVSSMGMKRSHFVKEKTFIQKQSEKKHLLFRDGFRQNRQTTQVKMHRRCVYHSASNSAQPFAAVARFAHTRNEILCIVRNLVIVVPGQFGAGRNAFGREEREQWKAQIVIVNKHRLSEQIRITRMVDESRNVALVDRLDDVIQLVVGVVTLNRFLSQFSDFPILISF